MPTINKPFLLRVVLVVAALTGILFGVHAIQADRIPDALRRQADRAAESQKIDLAIHYLRQYLEFMPEDVEAQIRLVDLLKKRAPTARGQSEVLFLYERILRTDPGQETIRREALESCLKRARYSDAVTHAEALLKSHPEEASLWQQLGAAQAGLHQLPAARQSYETALAREPAAMIGYQRLAQLLWRNMNDPAAARDALNRMTKAMPQSPEAHLVRARFETFLADDATSPVHLDSAVVIGELRRVLELDPENAEASLLLAEQYQRQRMIPAAHALLRDAVSLYPRDLPLIRSLSWLEVVRGNTPGAIAVLEDGLKANPEALDLLVPLADLLAQQGDTTRTNEILQRLESMKGNANRLTSTAAQSQAIQMKYLKARLAMRDQKWSDAATLLDALRKEVNNLPAFETQLNILLAMCAAQLADRVAEETAYQRVVISDP
ncbi:MAG TPA: tetratricopeptide repeat protein, partial [Gemmata sp.]|nr:tetratricopeptide repeat protein [Gemmata sp.]